MKLVRYGKIGKEKPGLIDQQGKMRDLSAHISDIDTFALSPKVLDKLGRLKTDKLPVVRGRPRLGAPISGTRNFIAVGLNYKDHAQEIGAEPPVEPIIFNKAPSCIIGCNDEVILPKDSLKTDWEVEIAVVIGTKASYVSEREALSYVAGYTLCNDISEREYQLERGGTWTKGKGCQTFGPLGPWLVTKDEIKSVQKLNMWLDLNGERIQSGSTSNMIFSIAHIVSYVSKFMVLEAGDVITTGTPAGVGMSAKPQRFLKAGDIMRLGIDGLGEQKQVVGAWR